MSNICFRTCRTELQYDDKQFWAFIDAIDWFSIPHSESWASYQMAVPGTADKSDTGD